MPLKSPGHSTYFGVVDEFHLFRINAPIFWLSGAIPGTFSAQTLHPHLNFGHSKNSRSRSPSAEPLLESSRANHAGEGNLWDYAFPLPNNGDILNDHQQHKSIYKSRHCIASFN